MNQKIETKKVRGVRKLANLCELRSNNMNAYYVGGFQCDNCPYFVKKWVNEQGETIIHCDHTKAANGK